MLALGVSQSDRDQGPSTLHPISIVALIPSPLPALGCHWAPRCPWICLSWRPHITSVESYEAPFTQQGALKPGPGPLPCGWLSDGQCPGCLSLVSALGLGRITLL